MNLVCFIIRNPNSPQFSENTRNEVLKHGFPEPHILDGSLRFKGDEQNSPVERAHLRIITYFFRNFREKKHIMVLEDDCEFVGEAYKTVKSALAFLDKKPNYWSTLHLGHLPAGPSFPVVHLTGKNMLLWTSLPFTGHAYIINRLFVKRILSAPSTSFKRPYSQEGFCQFSILKKYAIQPVIATQNRRPKELVDIDNGKLAWPLFLVTPHFDFNDWNHLFCFVGILTSFLLIFLSYILIKGINGKFQKCFKKSRRQKN
tara:strand:- start:1020 stop:1793 length:774 start_codon:yes stop_codon:yes gene_type:complete